MENEISTSFIHNSIYHTIIQKAKINYVYIEFAIDVGARDEIIAESKGLSHFIEHMLFKGTHKYKNSLRLVEQLYKVGGYYNGETNYDTTKFYIKTLLETFPLATDILFEMIFNSLIHKKDIEHERGVVENELFIDVSNPVDHLLDDVLHPLIFKNTVLKDPIIGYKKNIEYFTEEMIKAYMNTFYINKNISLLIISPYSSNYVLKKILKKRETKYLHKEKDAFYYEVSKKNEKEYNSYYKIWKEYFDKRKEYRIHFHLKPLVTFYGEFNNNIKHFLKEIVNKNHLIVYTKHSFKGMYVGIGFRLQHGYTSNFFLKENYILILLSIILMGDLSRPLYYILREQLGLVYSLKYSIDYFKDSGEYVIYFSTFNDVVHMIESFENIFKILQQVKENSVSESELENSKTHFKQKILIHSPNSEKKSPLDKLRFLSKKEHLKNILKITPKQVKTIINKIFTLPNTFIAIITDEKQKKKLMQILQTKKK